MTLRLNLGCGQTLLEGYVNVDKYGAPDVLWDLEEFPWPWPESSASEVLLSHVLEHLGRTPEQFIGVMKELYRVCAPQANVHIRVPHPRHDSFLADPTHVRPILPATLELFSRSANLTWQSMGAPNTPLALYHEVDFEIREFNYVLTEPWRTQLKNGEIGQPEAFELARRYNNVVSDIEITLVAIKA